MIISLLSLRGGNALATSPVLKAQKINDKVLVRLLNSGQCEDLNQLDKNIEKSVHLRLCAVGNSGDCVRETEGTCSYDYFLAVSEYDEEPEQAVFALGTLGEISEIHWRATTAPDTAVIDLTALRFPAEAIKMNKKLAQSKSAFEINVSARKLIVTRR